MTTYDEGLSVVNPFGASSLDALHLQIPGIINLDPVVFYHSTEAMRDVLPQITGLTLVNFDSAFTETWMFNSWGKHALFSATPASGDSLVFNPLTTMFDPTPVTRPLLSQLRVYNDATDIVEVKRVYKSNALTNTSGLTTATMTPVGEHTLTGVTNKTYRVKVDSAGTLGWTDATFQWSNDGGTTWQASGIPVATGNVAGRKVLAPILLDNGVSIMFTEGNLSNADYWTFTAIASGNQLYDLKVDTTNSIVKVGATLEIANDPLFYIKHYTSDILHFVWDTNTRFQYVRSGRTFKWFDGANDIIEMVGATPPNSYLRLPCGPLRLARLTTPNTPVGEGALYCKGILDKPYWLDPSGVESIIPQAAKAESITGQWTFSTDAGKEPIIPEIMDTAGGTVRITLSPITPHITLTGDVSATGTIGTLGGITGASGTFTTVTSSDYRDDGATTRILLAETAPEVTLTGAPVYINSSAQVATIYGSAASGGDLTLYSTSHATKGNLFFGTSTYDEVNNRLGIGTTAPGAANAYAKFHIDGTTTAAGGAHFKTTQLATDAYSMLHALSWNHDNIFLGFDNYYDGAFRSSSNTTNFAIYKVSGIFRIMYANAVSAGSAQTLVDAINVNVDGNINFGTTRSFGGGKGVIGITTAPTLPTTNPTGGGILYVDAGALKYRGSSGTVTTLGVA